jgi:hypothetical protein
MPPFHAHIEASSNDFFLGIHRKYCSNEVFMHYQVPFPVIYTPKQAFYLLGHIVRYNFTLNHVMSYVYAFKRPLKCIGPVGCLLHLAEIHEPIATISMLQSSQDWWVCCMVLAKTHLTNLKTIIRMLK